ncbi:MAG: GNAT family N-acetyltransferase [Candidatus Thiodiazotropha sp. (ex Troendleina suluensis)]|nr:GNAT family N-acetyltransferase [Candidatus Thiodiazotropha sp. (ex Troendleina suluensis)]
MIRKALEDDIPQLVEWMKKLVAHVQETSCDPYVANITDDHEREFAPWFIKIINSDSGIIYIAEEQDIPVGFILGNITAPFLKASVIKSIGQIELCWVEPSFRKKGIARKLCYQIEQWFRGIGVKYIDLQYLIGNNEAE